jgi:cytochrome c peroxidase
MLLRNWAWSITLKSIGGQLRFRESPFLRKRPESCRSWVLYIVVIVALALCENLLQGCNHARSSKPIGLAISIVPPLGLPPVPVPANNPPTVDAIALGRKLFNDRSLSNQQALSCASCHLPSHDFSDPHELSQGVRGVHGIRNASTLLNVAYLPFQFWDGRAQNLEVQVIGPVTNPIEMDNTAQGVLTNLHKDPDYPALFLKAFGTPDITIERVENAVASYERMLLSGDSAFDRYEYGGDKNALTAQQIRGVAIFRTPDRGNCAVCHTINDHYALFTDGKFHNIGEGVEDDGKFDDTGRFDQSHVASDTGAFKTPTLRDVAETGPYMHDGKMKSLDEVVAFYAGHGNSNPYLDKEITKIHLSAQDRSDLVAFLKSLTGNTLLDEKSSSEKADHP